MSIFLAGVASFASVCCQMDSKEDCLLAVHVRFVVFGNF